MHHGRQDSSSHLYELSYLNLDAFAPADRWEDMSTPKTEVDRETEVA
jgi:hypothetical protein